ncbi:unnamed protein product [Auanema sp. JU1783]|nr:unnamed protein product [Auanema sp. JU1783]
MLNSVLFFLLITNVFCKYKPTWESIDSRPLPSWYDDHKFGIFCHWGVYSVPAHRSEWLWWYWRGERNPEVLDFIEKNYPPNVQYSDFAKDFKADLFDPNEFAKIVKSAGAKYFVLTSKHHEGFTMWPSTSSYIWNAVDSGPKQNIVEKLSESMTAQNITFGLYYSLFEWFHPLYLNDGKKNLTAYRENVVFPQIYDLINTYKPKILWSDGDWERSEEYWQSKELLAWLYNESPVKDSIVVNDRWGEGVMGVLQPRKWENCFSMDKKSWGYRADIEVEDVHTPYEVIAQIARTVSCGGNVLVNVGPDSHGRIPLIVQDRLQEVGEFLGDVEEALYGSKPWIFQNDTSDTWYTARYQGENEEQELYSKQDAAKTIIYAWVLNTSFDKIVLEHIKPTAKTEIKILGTKTVLKPGKSSNILEIDSKLIPWRYLPRGDIIVLRIDNATPRRLHSSHIRRRQKLDFENIADNDFWI